MWVSLVFVVLVVGQITISKYGHPNEDSHGAPAQ